ncbi:MAG: NTP transferase domain-containing protein, partial [Pseudomonadota bacterium]
MQTDSLGIVVLAAGKGTRMKSAIPKVLHPLAAKPLLHHVLDSTTTLNAEALWVIYGYQGEEVRNKTQTSYPHIVWIEQTEQKGTGHAVQQILPFCKNVDHVLVLYGDVPLLGHPNCHSDTLVRLMQADRSTPLHILTVVLENPTGYGRIVRDTNGKIVRIVEEKDATAEQKKIQEVNTGVMLVKRELLEDVLPKLQPNNAQGELYLTDIVQAAAEKNLSVASVHPSYEWETWGVNSPEQLAVLERTLQQRLAIDCLQRGMRIADPARFDLRGTLEFGQ